jgi:hypothetical protein
MTTVRLALVAIWIAGAAAALPAQQARTFLVAVTDEAQRPVTGLGAKDCALKDGARQPVRADTRVATGAGGDRTRPREGQGRFRQTHRDGRPVVQHAMAGNVQAMK